MYQKEKVLEALQNTFFATRYMSIFPESVAELADKEEYRFDPPESVMFGVIAKNFRIPPRELLEYTYDELAYLLDSLRYIHLNDAQKAELQRLERVEEMKGKRQEIEELFAELEG